VNRLIHDRFLLQSDEAARLYFDYAADLPIIDYHTHLPPAEIAADVRWENISQVWLNGDHYKWRQMRANGIAERFCTGDATDREKFDAFAGVMPYLLRNPLYHWCHLELARYFQIDDLLLGPETADEVWERTSAVFRNGLSARSLIQSSHVLALCTTDDPVDSLEHHATVAADETFETRLLFVTRRILLGEVEDPRDVRALAFGDLEDLLEGVHFVFGHMTVGLGHLRAEGDDANGKGELLVDALAVGFAVDHQMPGKAAKQCAKRAPYGKSGGGAG
jgi:hypothetical protein